MIKIKNHASFGITEFKEFLLYFNKNFSKTITELSVSGGGECFIEDDFEMLAFDDIKDFLKAEIVIHRKRCDDHCPRYDNVKDIFSGCNCSELIHASADALHVVFPENQENVSFYFIEFKCKDLTLENTAGGSENEELDELLRYINTSWDVEDLDKLGSFGELIKDSKACFHKVFSHNIKLKAFESFYSILPHMYEEYCRKNNKPENMVEFKEFLFFSKVEYIVVYMPENQ